MSDDSELLSKTEKKKMMHALQQLGEQLVALSDADLAKVPIDDATLDDAIHTARRIKSREGKRRQMQYIGKLMRNIDTAAIEDALIAIEQGQKALARQFHELEALRDEVAAKGHDGVELVLQRFPDADRQRLRQLLMQIGKDAAANKPPAAKRKLFKYLRELQELEAD